MEVKRREEIRKERMERFVYMFCTYKKKRGY